MPDISAASPGQVFISYRRDETAYAAGWLYDRLADRFGADKIFKDIDSIDFGDDFVGVITAAVGSCDVLLALIGNEWVTITGEDGRRRLDDPADFVRVEIEAALARDVRVIPVLVDGASMPHAEALPASLRTLVRRHALELSPSQYAFDTGRLLKVLDRTLADGQAEVAATAPPPPVSTATDGAFTKPPSAPAPPERTGVAPTPTVPHEARSSGWRRTPGKQLGRLSTRRRIVAFGAALVVLLLLIVGFGSCAPSPRRRGGDAWLGMKFTSECLGGAAGAPSSLSTL
ncbi:MAG: toll/interleukin-1 receptor domain-containing protein [Aeromicrobium sp.]